MNALAPHPMVAPAGMSSVSTKTINLALQGGGAHGAFTWGVLDRLLEDERVRYEGISATSAGAMNAAVLAYGLAAGGRERAKVALTNFWRRISRSAATGPLQPTLFDKWTGNRNLENSPAFVLLDLMSRFYSPYQLNPLNHNPLRSVLAESVDFNLLRRPDCPVKLYIAATNVSTGKVRVFENAEMGPDQILASACLPFMFQAVEIDGQAYWDGGYMGNPVIFPLIYSCDSADVVVVHVNPMERPGVPKTASEILNRINEISFNSSLMREMRAISFVTRLIDQGAVRDGELRRMHIHTIAADEVMVKLGHMSKLNADWDFLCELRDIGRASAESWLTDHFATVGIASSIDVRTTYL